MCHLTGGEEGVVFRVKVIHLTGKPYRKIFINLKTGEKIEAAKSYTIAGWASVNEGTEGPQIWDVVENHIRKQGTISLDPNNSVEVIGA